MNIIEKDNMIAQIVCSVIPTRAIRRNGQYIDLLLRQPTMIEHSNSSIIYENAYDYALKSGLLSEHNLLEDMIILGKWTARDEYEIDGIKKDIYKIKYNLLDFIFNKSQLAKMKKLLRKAELVLSEKLLRKNNMLDNSAQSYALTCKQRYIISCITLTKDNKQFWMTNGDFNKFSDMSLILQLCNVFFQQCHLSIKKIRELARSYEWRVYWQIAKVTNNIFSDNIPEWSFNQRELAYWSTIYDSVNEAFERPSAMIIEDDDLLDSWFMRQSEKTDKQQKSDTIKLANKKDSKECFVMCDEKGSSNVYDLNDRHSRAVIKSRQNALKQHGHIAEQYMPDSQLLIRQQLVNMQKKHVKDISKR